MSKMDEAIRFFESNKMEHALEILEDIVGSDPKNEKANFLLGICYYQLGKYDHAEVKLRLVVSLNNVQFKAIYYLGLIAEKNNHNADAKQYYKRALEIKPDFAEAKNKLGDDVQRSQKDNNIQVQKSKPINTGSKNSARKRQPQPIPKPKGCLYLIFSAIRGLLIIAAGVFIGLVTGQALFREVGMIIGAVAGLVIAQIINNKLFGKKK